MTAYNSYLRTDVLHTLQEPVTDEEGERSFLAVCQVQELYFCLIGTELRFAAQHLRKGETPAAAAALRRAADHFLGLNASWKSLEWMTVGDFLPIKNGLGAAHGKSSSLQSWKYRDLVFLLGIRPHELADPVASMPDQHSALLATLGEPSVYDDVVALLARRGLSIPDAVLRRDPSTQHEPHPDVARAWTTVFYGGDPALADLRFCGEALMRIAEGYAEYKHLHLVATRRTFGHRPGYYGTSGLGWLAETVAEVPFPELWSLDPETARVENPCRT
ncbi:tryptophan 2,3-dioxygenase family protein [Amycolatopsis rhabdoformis]|uniref:Tryptophan 2,3-dioxygenase family protein n=1 Tax=Amycolatopsis rhabdoformis TaxID=1448059 RepID=A0ABZ1IDA1_9PSEU|nr:tryptophan 2,3-dioxygenase family protein [Amycolatopsis rhabdoformis]WSE32445.1 tryptophan 2,3-dioxygenase family protein [Amycolatopsis rhabdoformis]